MSFRVQPLLISFLLALIVNSDGFFKLLIDGYVAGSKNYVRALGIFVLVLAVTLSCGRGRLPRPQAKILAVGVLTCVLILLLSFSGNYLRGIYDALCVFIFFLILGLSYNRHFWRSVDWPYVLRLVFWWSVCFFIISVALGVHYDSIGRLSGFFPTSSIFATSFALLCMIVAKLGGFNPPIFGASVFTIILSGTRTGLFQISAVLVRAIFFSKGRLLFRIFFVVCAGVAFAVIGHLGIVNVEANRAFSTADLESGSASTRLYWYNVGWQHILSTDLFGGSGAGHASDLINGFLMHFDLLRIWIDYGILAVLLIFGTALTVSWSTSRGDWWVVFIMGFIFSGFHNAMQAPELIFLTAFLIAARRPEINS